MKRKVWLEVALNGGGPRRPAFIPKSVDELIEQGVACVRAGAAIVHFHAYDAASGRQREDPEVYAAVIEGIRSEVDAIVYGTLPLVGSEDAPSADDPGRRYAAVGELIRRGLLEWMVVDPGSVNFALYDEIARDRPGIVYLNPEEHVRRGLMLAERHGVRPSFAIYEPGFLRLGAALARRYPLAPGPVYRFMFSTGFAFGFPPEEYALDAYLRLLAAEAPEASWMIAGLEVDILPLVPFAVERGGHVRVGLEDAPRGTISGNLEWVSRAVDRIVAAGGEPASAAEVRASLAAGE